MTRLTLTDLRHSLATPVPPRITWPEPDASTAQEHDQMMAAIHKAVSPPTPVQTQEVKP